MFDGEEAKTNLTGSIRFGLGAVKGTGNTAVEAIVSDRTEHGPYVSIFDFCSRVSGKSANRATIESLVRGGAFDSLHGVASRSSLLAVLDRAISIGAAAVKDKEAGQGGLFGGGENNTKTSVDDALPKVTPWTKNQTLEQEKEVLGIHVSVPVQALGTQRYCWYHLLLSTCTLGGTFPKIPHQSPDPLPCWQSLAVAGNR